MERHLLSALLLVLFLSVTAVCGDEYTENVSCSNNQTAFNGSCYEFVNLTLSFVKAQARCERGGGHLVFIRSEETQQFLQKHLNSTEHNWWIGLVSTSYNSSSNVSTDLLTWLDGSALTGNCSNWVEEAVPDTSCGYISNESDFRCGATTNCTQEFYFICEFESGQSLACMDNHSMLQCDSGQVIAVNESFYGRNTAYYCMAANYSLSQTFDQDMCSWVDVTRAVSAVCNGHQVCKIPDAPVFGEPCPQLGSYLFVKYLCSNGSSSNDNKSSSQFKREVQQNDCSCDDLSKYYDQGIKIDCVTNCDKKIVPGLDIILESKKDVNNAEWYYVQWDGPNTVTPCKKHDSSATIHLSDILGNGDTYNASSAFLLNFTQGITIVLKGYKSKNLGYDCYDIQFPSIDTPTTKPLTTKTTTTTATGTTTTTGTTRTTTGTTQPTPNCQISPSNGNTLTPFNITCNIDPNFCSNRLCGFYLKTSNGDFVYRGNQTIMTNLFLPQGVYELIVSITNKAGQKISTTLQVQVTDSKNVGPDAVQDLVSQAASQQKEGSLSIGMLAKLFGSISDSLNGNYPENATQKLVESMSQTLCAVVSQESTTFTDGDMTDIASTILSLVSLEKQQTQKSEMGATCVIDQISKKLCLSDGYEVVSAVLSLVSSTSILLKRTAESDKQISGTIIMLLNQIQSAMLMNKTINTEPTLVNSPLINLYVNRVTPDNLHKLQISSGNISAAFSLPASVSALIPSNETVNLRMISFGINPFAWNKDKDISGTVGSLSLTRDDGSTFPVENLNDEIEILLPLEGGLATNKTFLNLTSYSTMAINVTAPNISLVLKLEPSDNTSLMLNLGFQYYPNDTTYVAKTQFPQPGDSQADGYTWVLNPKDVQLEVGVYYLLVRPIVPPGVNSSNASVFVTSISATCKYWNEQNCSWSTYGCRVGPQTTSQVTQCLCTHLTSFGSSFFVMPNMVDVSQTAQLFSTFANNPVVVCFVGAIFLAYFITVIWARRKDLQDKIKVRITVLEDNDPLAEYRYLVAVTTGHRFGAATTSHVTLTLTGTVWESKPHHLTDPEKTVFTRGGVDIFILTTPFSLGDLQSIRLWHDNSGEHPDWYVNRVMVQDLETGQLWDFLCNSWLAIDLGDCTLDKVFSIASETELKGFHNIFFTKTAKDLCDGHIWYSVLNRPANSSFTRVQRLSCCFSLLLCTMLTSIMFWGVPKSPAEQNMNLGTISFNIQQVMIGVQSSIIMFPVNLLIVTIFRSTRPRKKKDVAIIQDFISGSPKQEKKLAEKWRIQTDITIEIVVNELKKIVSALAKAVKCPFPNAAQESETTDISTLLFVLEDIIRQQNFTVSKVYGEDTENDPFLVYKLYRHYLYKQLRNLEKELRLMGPSKFPKPESYIQAVIQVQGVKQLLKPYLYSNPMDNQVINAGTEEEKKKNCFQKGFPWWFVFVGWFLVAATSGVSAYFTMMYGLTYGKDRSISWLISISVSFFESLFVTQPIKVLGFAIFFALVVKNIKSNDENYFSMLKDMTLTYSDDPDDIRISRRDSTCSFYQPPPTSDIEKMKRNYLKNQKAIALIKEIIIYLVFLCVLLLATYGQRDPNAYYLTQHIQQSFSNGINDSMSAGDVFTWANSVLISNLYGQRPGFITDGNSKLVGSARLRQIRVNRDSCRISKAMKHLVYDCNAPYSWNIEDMGSYGPGWNSSMDVNMTETLLVSWQYQTQSKLKGNPIWGTMAFYRGGGFVLDMGLDPDQASSMLQYLFNNTWLDVYTRAIFIEFTVYNANVNLFCIVTLMLETTAVGAFQYSSKLQTLRLYETTDGINIVASEVIYFLFILYYMFLQIKKIKQEKLQYFRSKYNLLELAIILLSLAAVGAIINRTVQGNQELKYFQEHKDQFPSFYSTASADSLLGNILAFLILMATVKMWHLMRLNSKLNLITCTLQRAWNDISSFIVVLIIMVLAYSIVSNLLFGWILYTYKTLQDSAVAIIALQLGIFDYEQVLNLNPVLGSFLILSCVLFMTFVVLNLFISVILEAFSHEQKHYKPSEEEEIVDLMIMKICRAFGIPVKKN